MHARQHSALMPIASLILYTFAYDVYYYISKQRETVSLKKKKKEATAHRAAHAFSAKTPPTMWWRQTPPFAQNRPTDRPNLFYSDARFKYTGNIYTVRYISFMLAGWRRLYSCSYIVAAILQTAYVPYRYCAALLFLCCCCYCYILSIIRPRLFIIPCVRWHYITCVYTEIIAAKAE